MTEWQPIESAPKDEWLLVVGPAGLIEVAMLRSRPDKRVMWWLGDGWHRLSVFCRWMPLPDVPDEILDDGARLAKASRKSQFPLAAGSAT